MTRDDIIAMAQEAIITHSNDNPLDFRLTTVEQLQCFAQLVAQTERNKVAQWMTQRSYATGHGDTVEDLLKELEWQVKEAEREACAKVAEACRYEHNITLTSMPPQNGTAVGIANRIRARGQGTPERGQA